MRTKIILLLIAFFGLSQAEDRSLWVIPKVLQPGEASEERYVVETDNGRYFIFYRGNILPGDVNESGCPVRVACYSTSNKLIAFYSGTIRIYGAKVSVKPDTQTSWGPDSKNFHPDSFSWDWTDPNQPRSVLIYDGYEQSNGKLRGPRPQEEPVFSSLLGGATPPGSAPGGNDGTGGNGGGPTPTPVIPPSTGQPGGATVDIPWATFEESKNLP